MKHRPVILAFCAILLFLPGRAGAQGTQLLKPGKLNVKFVLNDVGDAHIVASSTLSASEWDIFQRTSGYNPSSLKRQMQDGLPSYFLENFDYKEDAMNRSWTLSFDGLGLCKVNADGLWQLDCDSQNPDVLKISDRNYVITSTYETGRGVISEVDNVQFPDDAINVQQTQDAFGKAIFTYAMPLDRGASGMRWILIGVGGLLAAGGVFLLVGPKILA